MVSRFHHIYLSTKASSKLLLVAVERQINVLVVFILLELC